MNEEAYRSIKVKYFPVEFISSAVFLHAFSFMFLFLKSFSLVLYNIGLRCTNSIRRLSKVRQLLTNAIFPSSASYIDIAYFIQLLW